MTLKSTILFILISIGLLFFSSSAYSQMCAGTSKTKMIHTDNVTEKSETTIRSRPSKKVHTRVPVNYRPPVANEKLITFPETVATKKKQKKLLKKRKRTKKKGCMAANM
jgi:hypothetical protein